MTDTATKPVAYNADPADRARALAAFKLGDRAFYWLTRSAAISASSGGAESGFDGFRRGMRWFYVQESFEW